MSDAFAPAPAGTSVYLVGSSGHPNYGDELTTAAWLRHLATTRPDAEVWLDCPNPGLASHLFRGLHPRLRTTDSLFRLAWETTEMPAEQAREHVEARITHLGTPRYDLGLMTAREAGTVHVLGGGYLNGIWPHHGLLPLLALRIRELGGARLLATGLGLMPLDESGVVAEALGQFDHVGVRDAPSAEVLGVEAGLPDAFLGLPRMKAFKDGGYVADSPQAETWVCLQSDMTTPEVFDRAVESVRALLTSPEHRDSPVHYVECLPGVDRIAYDRLSDLIPEEHFLPFVEVWRRGIPFRQDQRWITSRFHVHLLAAACGARGTALELGDYYRVKHQSLLDLGTGWQVASPGDGTPAPTRAAAFRSTAARLAQDKQREASSLYA